MKVQKGDIVKIRPCPKKARGYFVIRVEGISRCECCEEAGVSGTLVGFPAGESEIIEKIGYCNQAKGIHDNCGHGRQMENIEPINPGDGKPDCPCGDSHD